MAIDTSEISLATAVSKQYYFEGKTQDEISRSLNLSRTKVGRLIRRARELGLVTIRINLNPAEFSALEQELKVRFGIQRALIAVDYDDEEQQRGAVAQLVADYLDESLTERTTGGLKSPLPPFPRKALPPEYSSVLVGMIMGVNWSVEVIDTSMVEASVKSSMSSLQRKAHRCQTRSFGPRRERINKGDCAFYLLKDINSILRREYRDITNYCLNGTRVRGNIAGPIAPRATNAHRDPGGVGHLQR